jgi:hypothetical protein
VVLYSRDFESTLQWLSLSDLLDGVLDGVLEGNVFEESFTSVEEQRICDSIESEVVYDGHNNGGRWRVVWGSRATLTFTGRRRSNSKTPNGVRRMQGSMLAAAGRPRFGTVATESTCQERGQLIDSWLSERWLPRSRKHVRNPVMTAVDAC